MFKSVKKRKFLLLIFMFLISICITVKALDNEQLFEKNINLTNSYKLNIQEETNNYISLTLYKSNKLIKKLIIGNAGIKDELIKKIDLNNDDSNKEYFISVYDKDSTYGAMTNIILWRRGLNWYMQDTPFERGFVEDIDDNGIYEIVNYYPEMAVYLFDDGLFIKLNNKK